MSRGLFPSLPTWSLLVISIVPALIWAALTVLRVLPNNGMLHLAAFAVVIIWALTFSMQWYNRLDELAHEAQKSAATWGGSFGLAAGLMLTTLVAYSPAGAAWIESSVTWLSEHARAHISPTSLAFTFGALTCSMTFVIGFLIAWAGWWIRKR